MPSPLIPNLHYRDAAKAIEWLCRAFGFQQKMVVPGEDGKIIHAQLTFGENGMVMLSSILDTKFNQFSIQPDEIQGKETQTVYVVVPDVKSHYAQATSVGTEILLELTEKDYGGADYTCRDLEGHIWTFGTYDPWKE